MFDDFTAKPTKGEQFEVGIKYQPEGRDLLLTAAAFDLEKRNILVTDPITLESVQAGKVRSRGIELEAKGRLTQRLALTAAYTFNDVEGRKGNTWYVNEGKEPIMTPRYTASLWLDYTLPDALERVNVGGGVRYVGKRWDDAENTRRQPSYTLADARIRYDVNSQWRVAVNINNLFNKKYYTSNAFNDWNHGEERTVTGSVEYFW